MADLKTDYKDDVLDTEVNELRKYQMIQNEDGTVSFVDVTEYLQVGDSFGSADINETNEEIENVKEELDAKVTNSFTANRVICTGDDGKLRASTAITATEVSYLDGVTSNIQNQLDAKLAKTGFTASRAVVTNANGSIAISNVTKEEIDCLDGVTSKIQTQLNTLTTNLGNTYSAVQSHATSLNDLLNRFGKVCKIITDWNTITESGFYMANNASNAPGEGWFMGIVIVHNSNYIIQEVWQFTGGDSTTLCNKYTRQKCTSWRPWFKEPRLKVSGTTLNITM